MELNAVLLPNGRVYGSCRDIRDRKLVEKALKESQENLQRMMDSMSEGMYGVDIEGNCTFANNAFLRILGYANADEILGKHIHSLIHHTHADGQPYPAVECPMYKSFKIQQPVHCDSEVFWRKDGQAVPVEYWCRQIIKGDKSIGAVTTFMDITERKEKEKHIHNLAFYDGLTGLPNRRLLMERVQRALAVSARNGLYGSIMLLDLDNFKRLNDTKGHDAGDALLCEVSNRLHNIMREGDTVARLGGDEFVVVLESLSAVADEAAIHAEMIAEKIRTALNEPFTLGTDPYQTSPSIGVVLFLGNKENIEALLKYADISMYQSKQAGRNTIRFFDQDMQMAVEARAMLETDILVALEQQQFRLYYQVQVNINGKPHGAETLIRWHHPNKGLIFPSQFIPVAEETGLIVPIGRWVLEEACAQIACWRNQRKFQKLVISVNVSAKQFRQPDFVELVKSIVTKHAINPMLLKLEMTETLVLENVEDTITKMRALKEFGVGFSMDDFGTGYSSLSYLKRLPLDQLKIDQSFVRNIATDNADIVMVSTIIDLAMNFELDVIAEGVETEAQLNKLHRFGCGSFQGYLFSKPIPVEQFEALIRERD
jgi:diguanylate cyclase (GGDEF)-like protein/PAS domain S-box-containing protein